jgi:hypothetical protein
MLRVHLPMLLLPQLQLQPTLQMRMMMTKIRSLLLCLLGFDLVESELLFRIHPSFEIYVTVFPTF